MLRNSQKIILLAVILTLLGFCAFVLSSCVKKEIKNTNSSGKNIICFGDSITFGYGVNPGQDYPTHLAKMVNRPVINAGVDGDTSIEGSKRIKRDVLDKQPYLVLIEFTGNDFLKKVPLYTTIDNLKEMIRQIQGAGAITAIVDVSAGLFLLDYRIQLSKLARETESIFIPATLSGIITNPSMKSDFMHPNAGGYVIVAQRVCRGIEDYIK
ncbi:MAG: GDSL-type esterase/lipase family protein [Candidatus Omnitrophota bacterium]|nr:GDSL-type esterase/lipase family protein [Candidatus Omnitrophota bacterium]